MNDHFESNDLTVFLLAESYLENSNMRYCMKEAGVNKVVTVLNTEHLLQEMCHQPDMVIINSELNNPEVPSLIQEIRKKNDRCQIVFLIEKENHMDIIRMLTYGSFEYVAKNTLFNQKIKRIVNTIIQWKQNFEEPKSLGDSGN